jgi:hypothetical protein
MVKKVVSNIPRRKNFVIEITVVWKRMFRYMLISKFESKIYNVKAAMICRGLFGYMLALLEETDLHRFAKHSRL